MSNMDEKPESLTAFEDDDINDMLAYLDALRESGVTNMFGAGEYLEAEFSLSKVIARDVLLFWMRTFSERNKGE